jgi:hypothetical protein
MIQKQLFINVFPFQIIIQIEYHKNAKLMLMLSSNENKFFFSKTNRLHINI